MISSNDSKAAHQNRQHETIIQGKPSESGLFSRTKSATDATVIPMQILAVAAS